MAKNIKPIEINSVSQFVDYVMRWERAGMRPIAFRGEEYHSWRTLPKIFRPDVGVYDHENSAIRDLISVHPQEFIHDTTMFDKLVRMQHFDLPTRLLDVSTNPLVALYFAAQKYEKNNTTNEEDGKVKAIFIPQIRQKYFDSDRASCMANLANFTKSEKDEIARAYDLDGKKFNIHPAVKRLLWFVRIEKPHFEPKIEPQDLLMPIFVKPKMSNRRIIAQSGAFLLYGARKLISREVDADLRIRSVRIAAAAKADIRDQLGRLGIHASSLFPEIDKAAKYITERYACS